jgi:hypothetical protein
MGMMSLRPETIVAASLCSFLLASSAAAATGGEPAAAQPKAGGRAAGKPQAPNTLSAAEKAAGWKLLFDGKSTKGWRGFKKETFPETGWVVEDGTLKRLEGDFKPGDIITVDKFESFEVRFDWRLSEGGNSGVKYLVDEALSRESKSGVSFEYQVLDDDKHPDAKKGKNGNRTVGSLYDLIPAATTKTVNAPGEWNESRILVKGNHVEHWLNGSKVLEFERGSPELKAIIAESKFKTIAGFGEVAKGHILIQDHSDEVAYRNIKLRPLRPISASAAK